VPTLLEYIHSAAERAGRYDRRTTTSLGTTSTLVVSDYVNSMLAASKYARFGVLIEDGVCAGEVGTVSDAGLAKSTGTLTTGDAFSSAVASGVTFSLYDADRLLPFREGSKPSWTEIANQALDRQWVEDTLTIAGVTGQIHYTIDTDTYWWLTDDTRIIEVQYPTTNADDVPVCLPRSAWSWVSDGETRRLRFPGAPFQTGQSFTLKVNRPASSRLVLNASARAVLSTTTVGSVVVGAGGYYSAVPTVTASGGGGSGATFTAVLSGGTSGSITSVTVNNAGSGYTSVPTLTVTRDASDSGWADVTSQSGGLVTLADEALPDVKLLRPAMLALAFEALAEMGASGQTVAEWQAKAAAWAVRAAALKATRAPRDARDGVARLRPMASYAPAYGRRGY
jgi:hypothetical protein